MANSRRISISLQQTLGADSNVSGYQNAITAWQQTPEDGGGPSPGFLTVPQGGMIVDLSRLVDPGPCLIQCIEDDDDVFVSYGIYDPIADKFYPFGAVWGKGPAHFFEFSPDFTERYEGTGTGTSSEFLQFMMKPRLNAGACRVKVDAFNY